MSRPDTLISSERIRQLLSQITPVDDSNGIDDSAWTLLELSRLLKSRSRSAPNVAADLIAVVEKLLSTRWYGWLKGILERLEEQIDFDRGIDKHHSETVIRVFEALHSISYTTDYEDFGDVQHRYYLLFSLQTAIRIMGQVDTCTATDRLIQLIGDEYWIRSVDAFVRWACYKRRQEGVFDGLMSPGYIGIPETALVALGATSDRRSENVIVRMLGHQKRTIRLAAVNALGIKTCLESESISALKKRTKLWYEIWPVIRNRANEVLRKLTR